MSADSRSRRGTATRRRLIGASERLFSERGVDAVSIRAINHAAGLGSASAHYHFGSKDALLEAVLLDQGRGVRERIRQRTRALAAAPDAPTARELVEALALPYLEQLEREPIRGRRWVRIVARLARTRAEVLGRLGEGVFVDLFAQVRRAFPLTDPALLGQRWRVASEALIQMIGEADDQPKSYMDELIGFVAGGVEAQLRSTPA
jgi:AcrR family transcriptional regulator